MIIIDIHIVNITDIYAIAITCGLFVIGYAVGYAMTLLCEVVEYVCIEFIFYVYPVNPTKML